MIAAVSTNELAPEVGIVEKSPAKPFSSVSVPVTPTAVMLRSAALLVAAIVYVTSINVTFWPLPAAAVERGRSHPPGAFAYPEVPYPCSDACFGSARRGIAMTADRDVQCV